MVTVRSNQNQNRNASSCCVPDIGCYRMPRWRLFAGIFVFCLLNSAWRKMPNLKTSGTVTTKIANEIVFPKPDGIKDYNLVKENNTSFNAFSFYVMGDTPVSLVLVTSEIQNKLCGIRFSGSSSRFCPSHAPCFDFVAFICVAVPGLARSEAKSSGGRDERIREEESRSQTFLHSPCWRHTKSFQHKLHRVRLYRYRFVARERVSVLERKKSACISIV